MPRAAPVTTATLNRLPPSRAFGPGGPLLVLPEARETAEREACGSGGLTPGPAESGRRGAAVRSGAAFGPAAAARSPRYEPGQRVRVAGGHRWPGCVLRRAGRQRERDRPALPHPVRSCPV